MGYKQAFLLSLVLHGAVLIGLLEIDLRAPVREEVPIQLEVVREKVKRVAELEQNKPKRSSYVQKVHTGVNVAKLEQNKPRKVKRRKIHKERTVGSAGVERKEERRVKAELPKDSPLKEKMTEQSKGITEETHGKTVYGEQEETAETPSEEKGTTLDLEAFREMVRDHLLYPPIARRMGWEGEVLVRVVVREGRVEEVKVERSSGHTLLDRSALRAVREALKEISDINTSFTLIIPVIFRLE